MTDIDMQAIVNQLKDRGIDAFVEQTGGGCATIFAGPTAIDQYGDERYRACAGPGWFAGPDWTVPVADAEEFFVGPDDSGEVTPEQVSTIDGAVEAIVALVNG